MFRNLIPILFALLPLAIPGCRKTENSLDKIVNEEEVRRKMNQWISGQYLQGHPRKNALLAELEKSLVFDRLQKEVLNSDEDILIVPVNKYFSKSRRLPAGSLLQLLMVMDKSRQILRAGLVLFISSEGKEIHELPSNTFYNIFHYGEIALSGKFLFFTVRGQWIYQLNYKEGRPESFSVIRKKLRSGELADCNEWKLITTQIGKQSVAEQAEVFPGWSCEDFCDEDGLPHYCLELDENCFDDPNLQWVANAISEPVAWSCGEERIDQESGAIIKTCFYTWNYHINLLLWQRWKMCSREELELEKSLSGWKIRAIKHRYDSIVGTSPGCTSFEKKLIQVKTVLGDDSLTARVEIQYDLHCLRQSGINRIQVFYGKTSANIKIP